MDDDSVRLLGSVGATVFETDGGSLTILPSTGSVPVDLQNMDASISCALNVQHVHGSTHVAGTINGVARVDCTAPAGALQISYSLIRLAPYAQWGGPTKTNTGWSFVQTNRAVPCGEGPAQFRGWAQGIIAPPPAYTLTGPALNNAYGSITSVACGAPLVDMSTAWDQLLAVTFVRNDLL